MTPTKSVFFFYSCNYQWKLNNVNQIKDELIREVVIEVSVESESETQIEAKVWM